MKGSLWSVIPVRSQAGAAVAVGRRPIGPFSTSGQKKSQRDFFGLLSERALLSWRAPLSRCALWWLMPSPEGWGPEGWLVPPGFRQGSGLQGVGLQVFRIYGFWVYRLRKLGRNKEK